MKLMLELTFRVVVWLFPLVFVIHVLEEWPRFTEWSRKHASALFTRCEYEVIHVTGIVLAVLCAAIGSMFPSRTVAAVIFAFFLGPSLLFNTVFHAGATLFSRQYCPGLITALMLYLPTFFFLTQRALQEGLLNAGSLATVLIVGAAFHTWEVGHHVFKAW